MKPIASRSATPAAASLSPGMTPSELAFGLAIGGSLERRGDRVVRTTATPMADGSFLYREEDVAHLFNFNPAPRRPQTLAKKGPSR